LGASIPIQKKSKTQKKSQRGPTQGPSCTKQEPRSTTEQVCAEEIRTETHDIHVEEDIGQNTSMDTQIPEASKSSNAQIKRTREQASGSRKKAKAHKKPLETSLTTDDVELISTTVEDQLSEVWENVENHQASILEKIKEVKTALE
jgi:hypothetical protein